MKPFTSLVLWLILAVVGINATSIQETPKIQNVKVETLSPSSVLVTWDALPPTYDHSGVYRVRYWKKIPGTDYTSVLCTEEKCSLIIAFLDAFTKYTIRVEAATYQDSEPMSDEVTQYTAESTPEKLDGLKCETLSSTEIRVSWQSLPLNSLHGTFMGYKVYYSQQFRLSDSQTDDSGYKETTANETILNGLKKNTFYVFRVLATNLGGDGIASYTDCRTESDVPDDPIDVKVIVNGTDKAWVLWRPPLESNGYIMGYTVYYRKNGTEPKTGKVSAHETIYEISGLEQNESYEFWVKASSRDGEGLASDYITKTISKDVPPQIFTYGDTFDVYFERMVLLPCDFAGSFPLYVKWMVNEDNIVPNEMMEIAANGSLIIKSVIREDANNYTCIAENEFGNDSITHKLNVEAPPKSPEITILSTTADKIVLKVKPNRTDSAPIFKFELYYKLDSDNEQWKRRDISDVNIESITIEHCNCGSPYLIYAIGDNYVGTGEASETMRVMTKGSKPSPPKIGKFIVPSAESVTLHFGSWEENVCPITHFFVEFKKKGHTVWTKIRNKSRPHTDLILNLEPATQYIIRVTAHNIAGSKLADYEIATLTQPEAPGKIVTNAPVTVLI